MDLARNNAEMGISGGLNKVLTALTLVCILVLGVMKALTMIAVTATAAEKIDTIVV
jgi:hypothetical protein